MTVDFGLTVDVRVGQTPNTNSYYKSLYFQSMTIVDQFNIMVA